LLAPGSDRTFPSQSRYPSEKKFFSPLFVFLGWKLFLPSLCPLRIFLIPDFSLPLLLCSFLGLIGCLLNPGRSCRAGRVLLPVAIQLQKIMGVSLPPSFFPFPVLPLPVLSDGFFTPSGTHSVVDWGGILVSSTFFMPQTKKSSGLFPFSPLSFVFSKFSFKPAPASVTGKTDVLFLFSPSVFPLPPFVEGLPTPLPVVVDNRADLFVPPHEPLHHPPSSLSGHVPRRAPLLWVVAWRNGRVSTRWPDFFFPPLLLIERLGFPSVRRCS